MALADVKTILIKATYNDAQATLVKASIDTAEPGGTGPPALHVEECDCPRGYLGTSCEDCAPGYTRYVYTFITKISVFILVIFYGIFLAFRTDSGLYLKTCGPCQCNGRSDICDSETGKCFVSITVSFLYFISELKCMRSM